MKSRTFLFTLLLAAFQPAFAADPQFFDAYVVGVADGDTITVLDASNTQHKIRLAGIDAPEKGQPFGERSKQSLSRAVFNRDVRIEWAKRDRYGRLVAKVWATPAELNCTQDACPRTLDVNLAQLTVGLAWHYKQYENEQSEEDGHRYAFAEEEARARKAGLWSEPQPHRALGLAPRTHRRPGEKVAQQHLPRTRQSRLPVSQVLHALRLAGGMPRQRRPTARTAQAVMHFTDRQRLPIRKRTPSAADAITFRASDNAIDEESGCCTPRPAPCST